MNLLLIFDDVVAPGGRGAGGDHLQAREQGQHLIQGPGLQIFQIITYQKSQVRRK